MSLPYLQELTLQLALGASSLDEGFRRRHVDWLVAKQRSDGGFAGREGESDPYYTAFALRGLWIAGGLDDSVGKRAADFLRSRLQKRESVIDLMSLIFGAAICEMAVGQVVIGDDDLHWRSNVAAMLETLRTDDGGFAKTPEGRAGSTYQTFLSVLCHQLIDIPVNDVEGIERFLASQAHDEGGYLEIRAAKRPGVNPTAAAIGTLKAMGRLDSVDHTNTVEFLSEMQTDEGGLSANTRIPFADLLSSFTGLLTLADLDASTRVNVDSIRRYALAMESPKSGSGGFIGFSLDQTADVEYTFYGLAALSMCNLLSN
ncbi:prenyltransferase/squalene oxidase repeat-containing protein [Rubripirellula reticaptiva]|uniref:Geranylgeranyl transferase type II subunit beta n=1 Tax=Rubripirellula reticaptiva TaxID=2528013 RepID=A0A5C6F9D2_9BACT|nr:prenyltransferase/squalene oxidase repeat-containing protein [Rubripirellula reticaptiva]TWU57988.1 Prenyltransferase and squalene oxidase repeat protein [Rubripirellula reticaptiva]